MNLEGNFDKEQMSLFFTQLYYVRNGKRIMLPEISII